MSGGAASPAGTARTAAGGQRVVVVGGGLSGISAAIALRDAGVEVTLAEARPALGGAAGGFSRGELEVDNGQHVFLGCCTQYRALLERLGATGMTRLQQRFDVTVLGRGRSARLRRSGLPAPLHLAGALARYSLLPAGDRLRVGLAAAAIAVARPGDARLDQVRLGDWLAARRQSETARRRLWDLFVVSALNVAGDEASTALAAKVIKTGLLQRRDAADIGVAAVPLGRIHHEAVGQLLASLGVRQLLRSKVEAIEPRPEGGFVVRLPAPAGPRLEADGVVLAVPAPPAAGLAAAAFQRVPPWGQLAWSPIINVHVIYDRQVMDLPFAAAVDSPVQWVFDRTGPSGLAAGQYLAISLSAADGYIHQTVADLRELFLPELRRLFPEARSARVMDFFVSRQPRATFRAVPGTGALRPGAVTPLHGLVLAGAWTDTGWPDTMEGAVRSGQSAAAALIAQLAAGNGSRLPAAAPAGAAS